MQQALWIAYDIVLDDDILLLLKQAGLAAYTRWPRLTGDGPQSGARLDNSIWPGANAMVLAVADEAAVAAAMASLQALRDRVGALTGLWAFTTPVLSALK